MRRVNLQSYSLPRLWAGAILTTIAFVGCTGSPQVASVGTTQASALAGRVAQHFGSRTIRFNPDRVTTPSFMDANAVAKPLLFIADFPFQVVDIYLQGADNKLVGQITGLDYPFAVATDAARNLYVVNEYRLGVQVYAPPYTNGPAYSLDTGDYRADYVGVSSKGVVGVLNYCTEPNCFPYTSYVAFFAPNSTTPCATVQADASVEYLGLGSFDRQGDFFVNGIAANGGSSLGEIKGGCAAKKMTALTAGDDNEWFGAIHVNKMDQPSIPDTDPPGSGPVVLYTYAGASKGSLGNPIATTMVEGQNRVDILEDFAFQGSGENFYLPDTSGENVSEYAYPAGGTAERTIHLGSGHIAYGLAVTPPLLK
jgi:hypothetical protein